MPPTVAPPATTPGTLYCVPTPIALDHAIERDLPAWTLERAAQVDYVIAEQAKSARAFLKRLNLARPIQEIEVVELNARTPPQAIDRLLDPLRQGRDAALVSEAGCPGVADPGALIVWRAHQTGIPVMPLIGPSAILLALMGSGLNGQCFSFAGYIPTDPALRRQKITSLEQRSRTNHETVLCIETPYRNSALFETLLTTLSSSTRLCVAADLSGAGQRLHTQTIAAWRRATTTLERVPTIFAWLASNP
jgi:16S rRNA (cytidine1402-2'-O)-methyltransferase